MAAAVQPDARLLRQGVEHFDIEVDADEIAEARWFTREDLRALVEAGTMALPGNISISRRLIEGWYGEELTGSW